MASQNPYFNGTVWKDPTESDRREVDGPMKVAILEPDLEKLDRALETLSLAGHLCFATRTDEDFLRMLNEVSAQLFILDWSAPDEQRHATLQHLAQHEFGIPVVLCVETHTPQSVIVSGMQRGATLVIEKPLCRIESLDRLYARSSYIPPAFLANNRLM